MYGLGPGRFFGWPVITNPWQVYGHLRDGLREWQEMAGICSLALKPSVKIDVRSRCRDEW